jgi:uncharacterized YccA/Bax inhibitor family protein
MLTTFRPQAAPFTSPMRGTSGVVLGGRPCSSSLTGVVFPAVLLTFGTLFSLLVVYRASGFRVTKRFRAGVIAATGGIALLYLVNLGLQVLGAERLPFLFDAGWTGIAFSLFVVVIAALNLIIDWLIERRAQKVRHRTWNGTQLSGDSHTDLAVPGSAQAAGTVVVRSDE